ncbi:unnamed protein product, partial [Penicillium nalgiovense]
PLICCWVLNEGMLLRAHSSYGIRCWTRLPQLTRCIFHPLSASSHFAHVSAAFVVILSRIESSFARSLRRGRAYTRTRFVEIGIRNRRMVDV